MEELCIPFEQFERLFNSADGSSYEVKQDRNLALPVLILFDCIISPKLNNKETEFEDSTLIKFYDADEAMAYAQRYFGGVIELKSISSDFVSGMTLFDVINNLRFKYEVIVDLAESKVAITGVSTVYDGSVIACLHHK